MAHSGVDGLRCAACYDAILGILVGTTPYRNNLENLWTPNV